MNDSSALRQREVSGRYAEVRMTRSTIAAFVLGSLLTAGIASADKERQPHMRAALASLQTAKNQLDKADTDKGGHRAKALDLVRQAIDEVKAGVEFDNEHDK